jgi:hypothetical protein
MKYTDYLFYLFFCVFLFLAKAKSNEYIYHKKIIQKKDPQKEKIFNYIRDHVTEDNQEKSFFLTLEEKKDILFSKNISSSLRQKLSLSKAFNAKNEMVNVINAETNDQKDLFSETIVSFLSLKDNVIKDYFTMNFGMFANNSFLFSLFSFIFFSLIKKGMIVDIALDFSREILLASGFHSFFQERNDFDIVDFLVFLKEKFLIGRENNLIFNTKAKRILEKIIIWNAKEKIEHERALNQFYNMAHREACCAVFSFYASNTKKVSSLEPYGDLHVDYDVYRSILFDYSKKPSVLRRRSFFDLTFPKQEKTFFVMPILKSNMVQYVAPLADKKTIDTIFSDIKENKRTEICSIIFLDEEDIRFLLY